MACVEAPTVNPMSIVTISMSGPPAVVARRLVTPLSFNRFPRKSMPSRGRPEGTRKQVSRRPIIGNMIFSLLEMGLGGRIRIRRSFLVVHNFIIHGWSTGTRAM